MLDFIPQSRRPLVLAALFLLVALALAAAYKLWPAGTEPAADPAPAGETAVQTAVPNPAIIRPGRIESPTALPVHSDFAGRVGEVYVTEGQAVKAGQPLFKIEPDAAAQRAANPPAGQSGYQAAQNEYDRLQKLYEIGAIPRRQLEAAAARLQAAKESGQAAAAPALQAPTTITAPLDGIVTGLTLAPGGSLQPGQSVMALGSGQPAEVVVPLQQEDLYLVNLGSKVAIELDGATLAGQVFSIFPEVRQNQIASFQVHIRFVDPPPPGLLKIGLPVNVRL